MYFYGSSLSKALMNVYKEHNWNKFKFTHGPNFWKKTQNQEEFLSFAFKELKLKVLMKLCTHNM